MFYTKLEQRFDELTPSWIVSTGRVFREFGDKAKFQFAVTFRGKTVRKATMVEENGIRRWREFETEHAIPDFVVLSKTQWARFDSAVSRCRQGLEYANPFVDLGCVSGWYIEVLGTYYHAGPYVQELSREDHEREVLEAYRSANAEVLLLWEDEVEERWLEVGKPKLDAFLERASQSLELEEWKIESVPLVESDSIKSLSNAAYWKALDEKRRVSVVDDLCSMYAGIEFPWPDRDMAVSDFRSLVEWGRKGDLRKRSRFGALCCRHFVKSMTLAKVKGKPSLREIWRDATLMRESVAWQLENADGGHNAKRFLNAMCHRVGFKVVSNMTPAYALMWLHKYGKVNGGILFDPCAGWGSRMLAAHVLGMKYVAIDANSNLVVELQGMADALGLDAEVRHGDSSDIETVKAIMRNRKAACVFTSPPFYDSEWYSDDPEQSILRYADKSEWHKAFLGRLIDNSAAVLEPNGVMLLNVGMDIRLDWTGLDIASRFSCDDFDVSVCMGGKNHKERLVRFTLGQDGKGLSTQCELCGRQYIELGSHLERIHGITIDEYRKQKPQARTTRKERERPSGLTYTPRSAYRLPDGSMVRRRDAWEAAWGGSPPAGSEVAGSEYDPLAGKVEGEDYVVCSVCGFKGANLVRHVKREHGLEGYVGPLKSRKCEAALKAGAVKTWASRGRREPVAKKGHKLAGLTSDALRELYRQGLSDAKIGARYGVSGEAIAYQRKKHGIEARPLGEKVLPEGLFTLPTLAKELGVAERTLYEWVEEAGLEGVSHNGLELFSREAVKAVVEANRPPVGSVSSEDVAKALGVDVRKARDMAKAECAKSGIAYGEAGRRVWFNAGVTAKLREAMMADSSVGCPYARG